MNGKKLPLTKIVGNGCPALKEGMCWLRNVPCIWRDRQDCTVYWQIAMPNAKAISLSMESEKQYDAVVQRKEMYELRHE